MTCPLGWRQVTEEPGGVATCDPFPEGGPKQCGDDEALFPGESGCSRIGTACTDDDWAADLPVDAPDIVYVKAGAQKGGAGTRDLPFGSIAEARDAASDGTVIALSKGTFEERVLLGSGMTLWGACVAQTLLTYHRPSTTAGVITVHGTGAVVRNLRISGARPGLWVEWEGRSVTVQDVLVARRRPSGEAPTCGMA